MSETRLNRLKTSTLSISTLDTNPASQMATLRREASVTGWTGLDARRSRATQHRPEPGGGGCGLAPEVLEGCAHEKRVLVTHGVSTATDFAFERVTTRIVLPGVLRLEARSGNLGRNGG